MFYWVEVLKGLDTLPLKNTLTSNISLLNFVGIAQLVKIPPSMQETSV